MLAKRNFHEGVGTLATIEWAVVAVVVASSSIKRETFRIFVYPPAASAG